MVESSATQEEYDPFADVDRARIEEFGDNLAEGVFWWIENPEHDVPVTDEAYWRAAVDRRLRFIDEIMARLTSAVASDGRRERIRAALAAARSVHELIKPGQCADFVAAWRRDREKWHDFVDQWRLKLQARPGWADQDNRTRVAEALAAWGVTMAS